jgi:hypothetical protein
MKNQRNIFTVKLVKTNGKLVHKNKGELALYEAFVKSINENQDVEVFFESLDGSGTKPQLAKIHVCIRELASEIGYTFEEMKKEIKHRSGLVIGDLTTSEGYVKSFADCSVDELGAVIETIIYAGEIVGINFRTHLSPDPQSVS